MLGLFVDKINRVNVMVYIYMLFVVGIDRWVFYYIMGVMSVVGCSLILGSVIIVMVMKLLIVVLRVEDVEW